MFAEGFVAVQVESYWTSSQPRQHAYNSVSSFGFIAMSVQVGKYETVVGSYILLDCQAAARSGERGSQDAHRVSGLGRP